MIAHYLATFVLTPERFDAAIARLAEHVTYRRQLVDGRDALANQARLVGDPKLARLSRSRLAQLNRLIKRLEHDIAALIAADETLSAKARSRSPHEWISADVFGLHRGHGAVPVVNVRSWDSDCGRSQSARP